MDFRFTPEEEAFRTKIHGWLEKTSAEVFGRGEGGRLGTSTASLLDVGDDSRWQRLLEYHRRLYDSGYVALHWPKEYGGGGATLMEQAIYQDEVLSYALPLYGANQLAIDRIGPTLMFMGTKEQKDRYLHKMLTGGEIWCQGYSEPNSGSDLASLQTRAVEQGDYFIVNGSKIWTSGARHADMIFLLVRTDPEAPKHKGISYLLVDMHDPGVTVRPLVQMTGGKGFNQVFFDDVKVPRANLVGKKNEGWQVAITTLMFERSGGAGGNRGSLGQIQELAQLAKSVKRNGQSAWEDSSVRQKIADFACEAEALKYTSFRQLTRQLRGQPPGPEGSVMKLGTTDLNLRIQNFAMELLGSYSQFEYQAAGAIDRGKWSHRMLAARRGTIAAGTNEIQHNIIGERVLGLPKG